MEEDILNIIANLITKNDLNDYTKNKDLANMKIQTYYDMWNIKHIKINLGYETYTITVS